MQPTPPTPDAETSRPIGRRFRFSILTLLLVTAIAGISLAYFRARSDLIQAQARLTDIRQTYQLIDVQDETKIYVRPMKSPADNMWQWRVYLPEGDQYRVSFATSMLGQPNDPASEPHMILSPGTYVISQMFTADQSTGSPKWKFQLSAIGPHADVQISGKVYPSEGTPPEKKEAVRKGSFHVMPDFTMSSDAASYQQTEHAPDQPVNLMLWDIDEPRFQGFEPVLGIGLSPMLNIFLLSIEREPTTSTPPGGSAGVMPCPLIRQKVLGHDTDTQFCHSSELVP